jgi:hypothetical protein
MDPQLKLHGGHTGNLMLNHPLGASLGAMALAGPCTWIAAGAEGAAVGVVMGLVGLVMGAPLGAMLADSATAEPVGDATLETPGSRGTIPRHH